MAHDARDFGLSIAYDYAKYQLIRCPFHNDGSPSGLFFKFSGDFVCKSCGFETKGPFNFAKALDMDPSEIEVEKRSISLPDLLKPHAIPPLPSMTPGGESWPYFSGVRKIGPNVVDDFGASLATIDEHNAIGFVHFAQDRKVGVTLRHKNPTIGSRYSLIGYKNPLWPSSGHRRILPESNYVFIFEGAFKLMRFYQELRGARLNLKGNYGVDINEVGFGCLMGSAKLKDQVVQSIHSTEAWKRLSRVVFIGDNDDAGRKVAKEFKEAFPRSRIFIPKTAFDDMSNEESARSAEVIADKIFSPLTGDLI